MISAKICFKLLDQQNIEIAGTLNCACWINKDIMLLWYWCIPASSMKKYTLCVSKSDTRRTCSYFGWTATCPLPPPSLRSACELCHLYWALWSESRYFRLQEHMRKVWGEDRVKACFGFLCIVVTPGVVAGFGIDPQGRCEWDCCSVSQDLILIPRTGPSFQISWGSTTMLAWGR